MDISNIKNHISFLDLHKDGRITTYNQQILDQGIILDDENYERLLALQQAGKLFYIDSFLPAEFGANIMPRAYDSVWDEATQSWIGGIETIVSLSEQAKKLFDKYNYNAIEFNKFTKTEQTKLITYLTALSAIIDGTNKKSAELPIAPF
jgi:hypothetical protein